MPHLEIKQRFGKLVGVFVLALHPLTTSARIAGAAAGARG
jgi:hypothetical protein